MSTTRELEPLVPTLQALQRLFDRFGRKGIIIGGAAVCLLGKPRTTADVDAVVIASIDDLPRLVKVARQVGLEPRTARVEEFARRTRVVLLRHNGSGIDVDISLGALPFEEEAIERSRIMRSGDLRVRLPTVEDLIIFKAVAHRPQDLIDIQTLVEIHPDLDRERIESWVLDFARLLEMPEIWDDVAKLLQP